jgi:hypothetical protein
MLLLYKGRVEGGAEPMFDDVPPPAGAVILFDGESLSGWSARGGGAAGWRVEGGALVVEPGAGDIVSGPRFLDAFIHLQFMCPDMPDRAGQAKANSGVYVQGRYELQVLDSYGIAIPGTGDCGAIYKQHAPLVNACRPPLEWQSYDIVFRAARVDATGRTLAQARLTVFHNGVVIHNNAEAEGPTGRPLDTNVGEPGPLLLQDHGDPVRYRNIWLMRLPPHGSSSYEPG